MKKLALAALAVALSATLALALPEKTHGKALTLKEATPLAAILKAPDDFAEKRVLVEGIIVDVCKKRGCWIKIGSEKETGSILFKVEDGVMVFPVEAKGKRVRAEGIVAVARVPKKEGDEHHGENGAKEQCTSCCAAKVMLKGEGAVVLE